MKKLLIIACVSLLLFTCKKDISGLGGIIPRQAAADIVFKALQANNASFLVYSDPQIHHQNHQYIVPSNVATDTLIIPFDSWLFAVDVAYPFFKTYQIYCVNIVSGDMQYFNLWGIPDIAAMELVYPKISQPLTQTDALDIFYRHLFPMRDKAATYLYPQILQPGSVVRVSQTLQEFAVAQPAWFFFIDRFYISSDLPRYSEYVFVDVNNGLIDIKTADRPPEFFAQMDTVFYQWERTQRDYPVMSFGASSKAAGCCNFYIHHQNNDHNAFLDIRGDTANISLTGQLIEYDLADLAGKLEITLHDYYFLPADYMDLMLLFCNDTGSGLPQKPPRKWFPVTGKVEISRQFLNNGLYGISLILKDMRFISDDGVKEIFLPYHEILNVVAGFCSG